MARQIRPTRLTCPLPGDLPSVASYPVPAFVRGPVPKGGSLGVAPFVGTVGAAPALAASRIALALAAVVSTPRTISRILGGSVGDKLPVGFANGLEQLFVVLDGDCRPVCRLLTFQCERFKRYGYRIHFFEFDAPKLIILGVADGEIRRLEVDNSHPA